MARVGVVYDSGFGHTAAQARAVGQGALRVEGVESRLFFASEVAADLALLDDCDALVLGSPTYMGSCSASFKGFMEATERLCERQAWHGRLAAGFTTSGGHSGDNLATLIQLALFAMQHGMVWVGPGLRDGNDRTSGSAGNPNRLGVHLGAAAQANVDQGPDGILPSDLATASHLGERVARLAVRLSRSGEAVPA
jgi:NAD(P)H dehydrogenase (quinone)